MGDQWNYPHAHSSSHAGGAATCRPRVLPTPASIINEIAPGVYLGLHHVASPDTLSTMQAIGITHIVCVQDLAMHEPVPIHQWNDFTYLLVELNRHKVGSAAGCQFSNATGSSDFKNVIMSTTNFVEKCVKGKGKVLVLGVRGQQSIGAVMVGYIMSKFSLTLSDAQNLIWEKGRIIVLSDDQIRDLRGLEHELFHPRVPIFPMVSIQQNDQNVDDHLAGDLGRKRKREDLVGLDVMMNCDDSDMEMDVDEDDMHGRCVRPRYGD